MIGRLRQKLQETAPRQDDGTALMLAFQQGDERAFDSLYRRYAPDLARFFHRAVFDPAVAPELVQETFFKIHRMRESYRPAASFRTYLYVVARSVLLNRWKQIRRQAEREVPLDPVTTPDEEMEADDQLASRQLLAKVEEAMHSLPERQRTALILVRYEEMSYEDAAQVMETSVAALKSILNRARVELLSKVMP